jgi:hypothetical protein
MKNVLIVMIFVIAAMLLGGCCCPTCPQEEWVPEIIGQKPYCVEEEGEQKGFLADMRNIAPLANHRWSAEEESEFTSVADTQKVIDNLVGKDIITEFLSQPGCDKLPFGRIKHLNGDEEYITAVMETSNSEVEFYILGPGNILVKIYPDDTITEIDFY